MLERTLTPQAVERLTAITEPWLSCDGCFDEAHVAIEAAVLTQTQFSEPFRVHLTACAVCLEEAESLAVLVAQDDGLSEEEALNSLDVAAGRIPSRGPRPSTHARTPRREAGQ